MEESPELRELTVRLAQAIGTGDIDFIARHTSHAPGVAFLGSDPGEWWTDAGALAQAAAAQHGAGIEMTPGEPVAYQAGDVGWAVDRGMRIRLGEREVPFRFSAVYRREGGDWKLVHFHSSVPVTNTEAVGVELPA
jgi:ketosteroid isomerase-like protein